MTKAQVHRSIRGAQYAANKSRKKCYGLLAEINTYWPNPKLRMLAADLSQSAHLTESISLSLRVIADELAKEEKV